MNAKMLIGGVLGGVVLFLLGYLVYGVLLADSMTGAPCMRTPESMNIIMIGLGNVLMGLFLAYIFSKWASISTFMGGAMAAVMIGLLMYGSMSFLMYGTTTMYNDMKDVLMDIVMSTVMLAIAGGVVGWWMGRK